VHIQPENTMLSQINIGGGSAGAMAALTQLLPMFPADYPLPIIVAQRIFSKNRGSAAFRLLFAS
jgi:chemotaxis response regulator CheB